MTSETEPKVPEVVTPEQPAVKKGMTTFQKLIILFCLLGVGYVVFLRMEADYDSRQSILNGEKEERLFWSTHPRR